jgi:hypothetical protein
MPFKKTGKIDMKTSLSSLGAIIIPFALGCGAAGTQPHAASAAQHETLANQEQQSAIAHQSQYQPTASVVEKRCDPSRAQKLSSPVCWQSTTNPTAEHSKEAEQHRELAAEHRAALEALRSAEASACAGIDEEDRDMSPFAHREDIRAVSPLREEVKTGKATSYRTAGATVVFRAVPGMTAEWLQRLVDCHLARNSTIGHPTAMADMPYCPLTLRGAQASVRSVGDGFAVTIRSSDSATGTDIYRRAESLQPQPVAAK